MAILSPRATRRRGVGRRGYTVIEVLVAISMLIISSAGIAALQKITVQGNGNARELATASQLARTWVERLRTDATSWNYSTATGVASDLTSDTLWLRQVEVQPNTWFRPVASTIGGSVSYMSPGFDLQGNDVIPTNLGLAYYCTHVRLSWMYPQEVIRADVRVVWKRQTGGVTSVGVCDDAQAVSYFDAPGAPLAAYNSVYVTSSILRNKPALQ